MVLFVRYILLIALGCGSAIAFVSATATTGRLLMSESSVGAQYSDDMIIWVMAVVALIGFLSRLIFALKAFPKMINRWFERHKDHLATVMLGFFVCLIFVLA